MLCSLHMRTVERFFTYNSSKFVIDFPQCWQLMQYHVSSDDFVQTQIEFSTRKAPKFTSSPDESPRDKTEIYSRIFIFLPTFSLFYFSSGTKYLKYLFLFFNASSTINRKVFVAICCGFPGFTEKEFFKCSTDSGPGYCFTIASEHQLKLFIQQIFPRQSIFLRCF